MIQPQTRLKVADNSGAKEIMCIGSGGSGRKYANIGDVNIILRKERFLAAVKKKDLVKVVIVRFTRRISQRRQLHTLDDNAAVIIMTW